jgi:hypothetical protein
MKEYLHPLQLILFFSNTFAFSVIPVFLNSYNKLQEFSYLFHRRDYGMIHKTFICTVHFWGNPITLAFLWWLLRMRISHLIDISLAEKCMNNGIKRMSGKTQNNCMLTGNRLCSALGVS